MLLTFSVFVMTAIGGNNFQNYGYICEWIVGIWAGGDLLEEILVGLVRKYQISYDKVLRCNIIYQMYILLKH